MGLFDFFKRKEDKTSQSNFRPKKTKAKEVKRVSDATLENPEFLGRTAEAIKVFLKEGKNKAEVTKAVQKKFNLTSKQAEKVVSIRLESYLRWGSFELNRNSIDGAKSLLGAALLLDPNSKVALINLGVLYSRLEDYEKSLFYYEKAVKLYPNEIVVQDNLASTYEELNNLEGAKKCYEAILRLDKNNTEVMFRLSQNLIALGLYEKALVYLEKVIKKGDENQLYAKYSKIGVLYRLGDTDSSLRLYRKMSKENPNDFHVHQIIPNWLDDDGKRKEAIEFLEQEYEHTKNSKLLRIKADFLYNRNQYQAIAAYEEYLEINPNDAEAIEYRMILLSQTNQEVDFTKEIDRILAINPNSKNALFNKGYRLYAENRVEEALECYKRLYNLDKGNMEYVSYLLLAYGKMYAPEKLDDFAKELQEGNPDERYNIEYQRGMYYKAAKEYDKAILIFESQNQEYEFAWNYYQIAIIENVRGNTEQCFKYLKKTFELDPNLKDDAKQYHELQNLWENERFRALTR